MTAAPLRPLGVGEIVDRTITLFRGNLRLLVGIGAPLYLGLAILGTVPYFVFGIDVDSSQLTRTEIGPALNRMLAALPVLATLAAVGGAVGIVQSLALTQAAFARYLGRDVTIGDALRSALRAAVPVFFAGLLGVLLILVVPLAGVALGLAGQAAGVLLVSFGGFSLAIIGSFLAVYLSFGLSLVGPVVLLEGLAPAAAVRRSFALISGHRWRALGLSVILLVIQLALGALLGILLVPLFLSEPAVQVVGQQTINFIVGVLWSPIQWAAITIFYVDLRVRKEAFDLQLASEALPRGS